MEYEEMENVASYEIEKYGECLRDKSVLIMGEGRNTSEIFEILSQGFGNDGMGSCKSITWPRVGVLFEQVKRSDEDVKSKTATMVADKRLNDGHEFVDMFTAEYMEKPIEEADVVIVTGGYGDHASNRIMEYLIGMQKQFMVRTTFSELVDPEIFPCVKHGEVWVGAYGASILQERISIERAVMQESMTYEDLDRSYCWITNMSGTRGRRDYELHTMAENLSGNKELIEYLERDYGEITYHKYEDWDDAFVDVPVVSAIPKDFGGFMGVPVAFLPTYDPEEFEIVSARRGNNSLMGLGTIEPLFVKGSGNNRRVGSRVFIRRRI